VLKSGQFHRFYRINSFARKLSKALVWENKKYLPSVFSVCSPLKEIRGHKEQTCDHQNMILPIDKIVKLVAEG
jgi:hypothetical protein